MPTQGHVPIPPDLAIEVLSPGDEVVALDRKLEEYQSPAIPLVWVFNATTRHVRVYLPDGSSRLLHESDTLDGGDILPGFSVKLSDLFPEPAVTA